MWEQGCAPKPINISDKQIKSEAKEEKKERKKKLKAHEDLVPLADEDVSKEMRRLRKKIKKERKEQKREEKREKRLRERTPDEERGKADDEGRWDAKKKRLDEEDMRDVSSIFVCFRSQLTQYLSFRTLSSTAPVDTSTSARSTSPYHLLRPTTFVPTSRRQTGAMWRCSS